MGKLDAAGIAWQRPPDYYAEMVKSDAHMGRIKEQLVYEQRQIEQAEGRYFLHPTVFVDKLCQCNQLQAPRSHVAVSNMSHEGDVKRQVLSLSPDWSSLVRRVYVSQEETEGGKEAQ